MLSLVVPSSQPHSYQNACHPRTCKHTHAPPSTCSQVRMEAVVQPHTRVCTVTCTRCPSVSRLVTGSYLTQVKRSWESWQPMGQGEGTLYPKRFPMMWGLPAGFF